MVPTALSHEQFEATFVPPMRNITGLHSDVPDVRPYVEAIPHAHLHGHSLAEYRVESIFVTDDYKHAHVLVQTQTAHVYVVVVVDMPQGKIRGHHLLDLNREFSRGKAHART